MILIDRLRRYPGPSHRQWCHMVSDANEEELHAIAYRMGLARRWFRRGRHPHYDLSRPAQAAAAKAGATQVTSRQLVQRMRRRCAAPEGEPVEAH